jgi:hypothetical protein
MTKATYVINVATGSGKCIPVYTSGPLLASYNHNKRDIVSTTVKAHQVLRVMTPCSLVGAWSRFELPPPSKCYGWRHCVPPKGSDSPSIQNKRCHNPGDHMLHSKFLRTQLERSYFGQRDDDYDEQYVY